MDIVKNKVARGTALALAMAAALGAGAASAQPIGDGVLVRFGDLDTSSTAGARTLLQRIRYAATKVCGYRPDSRMIDDFYNFRRCRADAVDRAVLKVDLPLVTALDHGPKSAIRLAGS